MIIGVLSGAVKNAGDYLIVERGKKLIASVFNNSVFIEFDRLKPLSSRIDEVNKCNIMFIVGGPAFLEEMYPNYMPLCDDLNDIHPPILTLGNGWYGKNNLPETIYQNYQFSSDSQKLMDRLIRDGSVGLSCRDWYSWRFLKNNGIDNVTMTGCPAWFDLEKLTNYSVKKLDRKQIKRICVSDPAYKMNIEKAGKLVEMLRANFPQAEIDYVFHRGDSFDGEKGKLVQQLINDLESLNVNHVDISGSSDGFKIYDDCDLHFGFRVHAHIYNMSIRNISILVEEDARGKGFDSAVGIEGVQPYFYEYIDGQVKLRNNDYFIKECNDLLEEVIQTEAYQYKMSYVRMEQAYDDMVCYLERIRDRLLCYDDNDKSSVT